MTVVHFGKELPRAEYISNRLLEEYRDAFRHLQGALRVCFESCDKDVIEVCLGVSDFYMRLERDLTIQNPTYFLKFYKEGCEPVVGLQMPIEIESISREYILENSERTPYQYEMFAKIVGRFGKTV